MPEKFIISPEAAKIFTPEQLRRMAKEAVDNESAEAKRAGDYVEEIDNEQEFKDAVESENKSALPHDKPVKEPKTVYRKYPEGYVGWQNDWEKDK